MKQGKSRRNRRSTPAIDEDKPDFKSSRNTSDVEAKGPSTPVRDNHENEENCIIKSMNVQSMESYAF